MQSCMDEWSVSLNDKSHELDLDLVPKGKKARREKDSSRAAIRGFRKGSAYYGRLAKPGYVAACHSRKPEALVKVVKNPPRGYAVRRLFHYIARSNQIDAETGDNAVWLMDSEGHICTSPEEVEALAKAWAETFNPDLEEVRKLHAEKKKLASDMDAGGDAEKANLRFAEIDARLRKIAQKPSLNAQRRQGRARRDVAHMILSAKSDNTPFNQQRVLAAAERTAAHYFSGHEYVIGLHGDSKNPHVHIVVKSQAKEIELGKLRLNKPELHEVRSLFAKELTQEGLEHVATLREDRPHVLREVAAGKAPLKSKNLNWFAASIEGLDAGMELVAKRQKDLDEALKRGKSHQEAAEIRKQIGQSINELRAQVRAKTIQGDKAREAAFHALKRIERDLTKKADPLLKLNELAESSGQHRPVFQTILTAVEHAPRARAAKSAVLDYEGQAALAAAQERIATAWAELKRGGLTREEFKISAQVLSFHEKEVMKAFGIEANTGSGQSPMQPAKDINPKRDAKKAREVKKAWGIEI